VNDTVFEDIKPAGAERAQVAYFKSVDNEVEGRIDIGGGIRDIEGQGPRPACKRLGARHDADHLLDADPGQPLDVVFYTDPRLGSAVYSVWERMASSSPHRPCGNASVE